MTFRILGLAMLCAALGGARSSAITIDWRTVANPGNADDATGSGGVDYIYRISRYEVTNAQYAGFLNAVDPGGANALMLYSSSMSTNAQGGINYNGAAPGGLKYEIKLGRGNNPVVFVSFFDAMRFTNWLENGQGSGGTESGVYTIASGGTELRNPSARFFIPSEDEWYKAAYHKNDGVTGNYWDYPTASDADPYSDNPANLSTPDNTNVANVLKDDATPNGYDDGYAVTGSPDIDNDQDYLTNVGAYSLADSAYGTYDQGGNVWEWNEAATGGLLRDQWGGGWRHPEAWLKAGFHRMSDPSLEFEDIGFRVASLPDPNDADFDHNGLVDGSDLLKWQRGESTSPLSGQDLSNWKARYGSSSLPAMVSVAEPSSATPCILSAAVLLRQQLKRRKWLRDIPVAC